MAPDTRRPAWFRHVPAAIRDDPQAAQRYLAQEGQHLGGEPQGPPVPGRDGEPTGTGTGADANDANDAKPPDETAGKQQIQR